VLFNLSQKNFTVTTKVCCLLSAAPPLACHAVTTTQA
jgi:hypothetical protein